MTSLSQVPLSTASPQPICVFFPFPTYTIEFILVKKIFSTTCQIWITLVSISKVTLEEGHTCTRGQILVAHWKLPNMFIDKSLKKSFITPKQYQVFQSGTPQKGAESWQILCPRGCLSPIPALQSSCTLQRQILQAAVEEQTPLEWRPTPHCSNGLKARHRALSQGGEGSMQNPPTCEKIQFYPTGHLPPPDSQASTIQPAQ